MKTKVIVLFSGGLDSTTCLAIAKHNHDEVYALSFDYGQKHRHELNASQLIAKKMELNGHKIVTLPTHIFQHSSLTNQSMTIPDHQLENSSIPSTYVPARNTIFLSFGLAYAESIGATHIYIGVSQIDYSGYPDCRPEFIEAFQHMANLATKSGINGQKITISSPLINLSKAETIKLGLQHNVDYGQTVSCYRSNEQGQACGACDSCILRKKGFMDAGVIDPTSYYTTKTY